MNWLNNKLGFGDNFRCMELPVFVLFFVLLRTNDIKFLLLSVLKGNTSLIHLKHNYGSVIIKI